MKTIKKVCYLLLNISIPTGDARFISLEGKEERFSQKDQIKIAKKACNEMGVKIRVLEIRTDNSEHLRFVFHTPYFRKNDRRVTKAIESFLFSLSLFTPTYISDDFIAYYCFPSSFVHNNLYISGDELVRYEETRPYEKRVLSSPVSDLLSFGVSGSHYDYMRAWKFSPIIFSNNHLFNAARFFVNSQKNFYISSGEIVELVEESDEQARNSIEQNILEDALIHSKQLKQS